MSTEPTPKYQDHPIINHLHRAAELSESAEFKSLMRNTVTVIRMLDRSAIFSARELAKVVLQSDEMHKLVRDILDGRIPPAPIIVQTPDRQLLTDFASYLTCRHDSITLGASHEAPPILDLIEAYLESKKGTNPL